MGTSILAVFARVCRITDQPLRGRCKQCPSMRTISTVPPRARPRNCSGTPARTSCWSPERKTFRVDARVRTDTHPSGVAANRTSNAQPLPKLEPIHPAPHARSCWCPWAGLELAPHAYSASRIMHLGGGLSTDDAVEALILLGARSPVSVGRASHRLLWPRVPRSRPHARNQSSNAPRDRRDCG